jgi:hypothetical protein
MQLLSFDKFAGMHTRQRKALVEPMINCYFTFLNLFVHCFKEFSDMSFRMKWINVDQATRFYFCGLCHIAVSVWAV